MPLGLGLRFDTKYNEQTGLLQANNLALQRFQPGEEGYDCETDTYRHLYTRTDAIPKPYDESGWEGQQDATLHFSESVEVESLLPGTLVHVLFHFHDNYCDSSLAFLDRDKAELAFKKCEDEMWEKLESLRHHNSDHAFCVVKHDKWHCDLLECELTGRYTNQTGGWTRPDKGDTRWLRSVVL